MKLEFPKSEFYRLQMNEHKLIDKIKQLEDRVKLLEKENKEYEKRISNFIVEISKVLRFEYKFLE